MGQIIIFIIITIPVSLILLWIFRNPEDTTFSWSKEPIEDDEDIIQFRKWGALIGLIIIIFFVLMAIYHSFG
ncbi:hypothetical protein PRVXH_001934 [Proteinivorax hydrogeniformans]|uniref:Uncharacterized protein n=1 Tax=Proteinivorax hydrogeniformans TaxID=1826727 RepID=A0AAU8HS65_9FIRM